MGTGLLIYVQNGTLMAAFGEGEGLHSQPLRKEQEADLLRQCGEAELALCPGGCVRPVSGGVYRLTDAALEDARHAPCGAELYGQAMTECARLAQSLGVPAYFTDAMSTDERLPLNRVGSHRQIPAYSRGFRVEHLASLRQALGRERPEDGNYIAVYMDDLVSIGAYSHGRCLDLNDCLGAEGPMGFTASGDVPCAQLADYFAGSDLDIAEMENLLLHKSGLLQYLGTSEPGAVQLLCEKDAKALQTVQAMAYQIAKWVGGAALTLHGDVQKIVLSGKGVQVPALTEALRQKLQAIAPIQQIEELDLAGWLSDRAALVRAGLVPVQQY